MESSGVGATFALEKNQENEMVSRPCSEEVSNLDADILLLVAHIPSTLCFFLVPFYSL